MVALVVSVAAASGAGQQPPPARVAAPSAEVLALLKSVGELLGLALDNARLESENLRAVVLNERQMLAAEVHDSVAQTLAFIKMRMPLLQEAIALVKKQITDFPLQYGNFRD